ncbi:JmjC-domain-containing protein, partial [Periconia macrospinosa]
MLQTEVCPILSSGALKTKMKPTPGVNTSYLYVSPWPSTWTFNRLHWEDCGFLSANILLAGEPKVWLAIDPASNAHLEQKMSTMFPDAHTCSMWVSHASTVLSTNLLEEWGIGYTIQVCRPGQLIFTMPGTYHQVVNMGQNVAEAINFTFEQ